MRVVHSVNDHALDKTGLSIDDIDVIEINEAFAPVVLAWMEASAPIPTGSTSMAVRSRWAIRWAPREPSFSTSLLCELERTREDVSGCSTICEGGGTANVTIIERLG